MSLKKSLALSALVAVLATGSLAACGSVTTSDIKTTSTAAAQSGWSFDMEGDMSPLKDLPSDIPVLDDYSEAKATGDQTTGDFQLALKTGRANAVKDAGAKLEAAGFTAKDKVYTSSAWKVTLEGTGGQVHYTIAKNS